MTSSEATDRHDLTAAGVAETVRLTTSGEATAVEVVEACLARIAERDPGLNAFSRVLAAEARAEAAERDRSLAAGDVDLLLDRHRYAVQRSGRPAR